MNGTRNVSQTFRAGGAVTRPVRPIAGGPAGTGVA